MNRKCVYLDKKATVLEFVAQAHDTIAVVELSEEFGADSGMVKPVDLGYIRLLPEKNK